MKDATMDARSLEDLGVDCVFGYTGSAIPPVMDEIGKGRIRIVVKANEQCSAFATAGYSRSSDRVGIVIITSGPAITNTLTAVADSYADRVQSRGQAQMSRGTSVHAGGCQDDGRLCDPRGAARDLPVHSRFHWSGRGRSDAPAGRNACVPPDDSRPGSRGTSRRRYSGYFHASDRAVSTPDQSYRDTILPSSCRRRVAVEAGVMTPWRAPVGLDGKVVGIDRFGVSAPGPVVMREMGITVHAICEAVRTVRTVPGEGSESPNSKGNT